MSPLEVARDVLAGIIDRKERLEKQAVIPDDQWQYASGMLAGARAVVRAIEGLRADTTPAPLAKNPGDSGGET